jgi:hypothetical protein
LYNKKKEEEKKLSAPSFIVEILSKHPLTSLLFSCDLSTASSISWCLSRRNESISKITKSILKKKEEKNNVISLANIEKKKKIVKDQ